MWVAFILGLFFGFILGVLAAPLWARRKPKSPPTYRKTAWCRNCSHFVTMTIRAGTPAREFDLSKSRCPRCKLAGHLEWFMGS